MDLKELSSVVAKSAPLLASAISSVNPLAGIAVSLISQAFGVSNKDDLSAAIQQDPNAAIKLQEIELKHKESLMQIAVTDSMNARDREEKIVSLTGKRDWILDFLSVVVTIGFFSMCVANYFARFHDSTIMMMWNSAFMLVLSYYFGRSIK